MANENPINVFISYSNNEKDRIYLLELNKYLKTPKWNLRVWNDGKIIPGKVWDKSIKENLIAADVVLLLISVDFNNSDYINNSELPIAFQRQREGFCEIVPIYIRECPYDGWDYAKFGMIPSRLDVDKKLKPIDKWENKNEAFTAVFHQLEETFKLIMQNPNPNYNNDEALNYDRNPWPDFFKTQPLLKKIPHPIHTVNCDRNEQYKRRLSKDFGQNWSKEENLIYFISACPTQKPESLAMRLIYANDDKISKYFKNESEEVDIVDIDIVTPVERTWEYFWNIFQDRILKKNITFEKFITNPTPYLKKEKRIALTFRIQENNWGEVDEVHEYVCYILEKVSQLPIKYQKFVLFFIFNFLDSHLSPSEECCYYMESLKDRISLEKTNPQNYKVLYIDNLVPVDEEHINKWASGFMDIRVLDKLIKILIKQSAGSKQKVAEEQKRYDMLVVEEMQLAAYKSTITKP